MTLASRPAHGEVVLPEPLPPSEAAQIRRIFALQAKGDLAAAAEVFQALGDHTLDAEIIADRYLMPGSRVHAAELIAWLSLYADLPDAPAIHALLRRTSRTARLPAPKPPMLGGKTVAAPASEEAEPAERRFTRNPLLDRTVRERAHAGNAASALRLLSNTRNLDPLYGAELRAEIAQILFTQGHDAEAMRVAEAAHQHSAGRVGLADYIAGLAAWRMERIELAQPLFEAASRAEFTPASRRAGAAFWAARAHLRNRDPAGYGPWMHRAATERRTFYGQLARHVLGDVPAWSGEGRETLGLADIEALAGIPQGVRTFALLQVGQTQRAEAELRALLPIIGHNSALGGSILRVAEAAGLTGLAAELAGLVHAVDGRQRDDTRFPVPALRPKGGFRMDPALVYALTRLESNFDPDAISAAGARGLMQIMPDTANYIADAAGADTGSAERLHDPALNLALGQTYVIYLAQHGVVNGNLIRLLASYNAGPTSFARMSDSIHPTDDPLLFIESIPNDETRAFVPRALAYTWIYADRLNLPAPSLDELAAGAWPSFHLLAPRAGYRQEANRGH